jgi:hypothetical protein
MDPIPETKIESWATSQFTKVKLVTINKFFVILSPSRSLPLNAVKGSRVNFAKNLLSLSFRDLSLEMAKKVEKNY